MFKSTRTVLRAITLATCVMTALPAATVRADDSNEMQSQQAEIERQQREVAEQR